MKTVGIICEYNPFHNGHKYHIEASRKISHADAAVCIMSGNFVQRGGLAIADKWTRTKSALAGGADLVIELPVYYAASVAQLFAFGAVCILDALGCIDFLSFGIEEENIQTIEKIAYELESNEGKIASNINGVDWRKGYPAVFSAYSSLCGEDINIIKKPNNILALEYIRAIKRIKSHITPVGIKRIGEMYKSENIGELASAEGIRNALKNGADIETAIPENVLKIYNSAYRDSLFPVFDSDFDSSVLSVLRSYKPAQLENIIDMPHGFANRIIACAKKALSIDELVDLCCVKQYTRSRVRRLIFASFLGIKSMGYDKKPSYIRILGANETGKALLNQIKKTSSLPVVTKAADYNKKDSDELFLLDMRASDLYFASCKNSAFRGGMKDFITSPIMI